MTANRFTLELLGDDATLGAGWALPADRAAAGWTWAPAPLPAPADLEAAVRHTRDWPSCYVAVSQVTHAWQLAIPIDAVGDRHAQLVAINALLDDILVSLGNGVLAVHWPASQKLVHPPTYRGFREASAHPLLPAALNIRLTAVADGHKDETIMDAVGLSAWGLPDPQIHFVGHDPFDVAHVLTNLGCHLFDHGPLAAGQPIAGPDGAVWISRSKPSALPPNRPALDLWPGEDNAVVPLEE